MSKKLSLLEEKQRKHIQEYIKGLKKEYEKLDGEIKTIDKDIDVLKASKSLLNRAKVNKMIGFLEVQRAHKKKVSDEYFNKTRVLRNIDFDLFVAQSFKTKGDK